MSKGLELVLSRLRDQGCWPRAAGPGWSARCPAHDDSNASLSVTPTNTGRVLLNCFAGCEFEDIIRALGVTARDIAGEERRPRERQRGLSRTRAARRERHAEAREPVRDWSGMLAEWQAQADDERVDRLVRSLGAPEHRLEAWRAAARGVGVGWCTGEQLKRSGYGADGPAWVFPFRDAEGAVVGLSVRFEDPDAKKKARGHASQGVIHHEALGKLPGPVLVVEGASDVIAAATEGLPAVGRLSAASVNACPVIARLCAGRGVYVIAERDEKPDGRWPGLEGARKVAAELEALGLPRVGIKLPPEGVKDLRQWLLRQDQSRLHDDDA